MGLGRISRTTGIRLALVAVALTVSLPLVGFEFEPCGLEPVRLGAPFVLLLLGSVGLGRGRVWGLAALLIGTAGLISVGGVWPWSIAIALETMVLLALIGSTLWTSDRLATVVLVVGALGLGAGLRQVPLPYTRLRFVEITAAQIEGQPKIRVTFRNPGEEPLELDLPIADITYAPHFDPLLRVVAFDGSGDRLQHIQSFGCGMVYSYPKVKRVKLAPGQSTTRVLWLPYRHYPSRAVLPGYSHLMLINKEEMEKAPPGPPPIRRIHMYVSYQTARVERSWRDDLHSPGNPPVRVDGASEGFTYIDRWTDQSD